MIGAIATGALLFIFLAYAIPHFIVAWFYKTKNLKKAYNAEWALVTGASSGGRPGHRHWRQYPPPTSVPAATSHHGLPPASPRHGAHAALHALTSPAAALYMQASASRSHASWPGRA